MGFLILLIVGVSSELVFRGSRGRVGGRLGFYLVDYGFF